MRSFLTFLLLVLTPAAFAQSPLRASLDSSFLVVGEAANLTIYVNATERPASPPTVPSTTDVAIKFREERLRILPNRQRVFAYTYSVQSFNKGIHFVPPFSIVTRGKESRSAPIQFEVAGADTLTYNTLRLGKNDIKYYSAIFEPPTQPYERESFPAEVKVYLPEQVGNPSSGVAELEHDGVVAWRFEAVPSVTHVELPTGTHVGITFRSTASPIRSGKVSLGPGQARIVLRLRRSEGAFTIVRDTPVSFQVPQKFLSAKPLPDGAPASFNGAVGRFSVAATADTDKLEEGDPIAVRLTVTGTGNLDNLPAPAITASPSEWKSYEPSRLERQGERREASGSVNFSQIIRPLVPATEIPPFELAFFDPRAAKYETIRTAPIPYNAKPVTKTATPALIAPSLATPVEDMQGILGLVDPLRASSGSGAPTWLRYWQILPAILGLLLLFRLVQRHILPRFAQPERERQIMVSLQLIEKAGDNPRDFLRATGHFIERWIPPADRNEELSELLEKRDIDCYRPDSTETAFDDGRRRTILRQLKTTAISAGKAVALIIVIMTGFARGEDTAKLTYRQADQAWAAGKYRVALDFYTNATPGEPLGADLLYNIGNCHYQLGEPGQAALFYHRALIEDPRHPEAGQNLRFLERTQGSIVIVRRPYEHLLGKLRRGSFRTALIAGAWTLGLSILGIFALTSKLGRLASWTGLAGGIGLTTAAAIAVAWYPDDAEFAALGDRGIVTASQRIPALTEASAAGKSVIEAPPGSLCRILAPRGTWTYVEFANKVRAWLPSDQIAPLVPTPDKSPITNNL